MARRQFFPVVMDSPHKTWIVSIGTILLLSSIIVLGAIMTPFIKTLYETTLGKPQLVRETTRKQFPHNITSDISDAVLYYLSVPRKRDCRKSIDAELENLIISDELKDQIRDFVYNAKELRKYHFSLQNILIHGPGSGKKTIAKRLAEILSFDFAVIDGRDIQLNDSSIDHVRNVFSWASGSNKGLILFVEKAELFLMSEGSEIYDIASDIIELVLHSIGRVSKNVILVFSISWYGKFVKKRVLFQSRYVLYFFYILSSLFPPCSFDDLNNLIIDLCEENFHLQLPDADARRRFIFLYFENHITQYIDNFNKQSASFLSRLRRIFTKDKHVTLSIDPIILNSSHVDELTAATRGFNGKEIDQVMILLQKKLSSSSSGYVDFRTFWDLIQLKVKDHQHSQSKLGEHELNDSENDIEFI